MLTQYVMLLIESVSAPEPSSEGLQTAAELLQACHLPGQGPEAITHCHCQHQNLMLTHCLSQQNAHGPMHQRLVEL